MSTRRDKLQEGSGISAALRPRGQLDGLPSSVTGCPTARVLCPVWRPALAPRVMGYPTACDRLTSPCIDGLGCRLSVWCPRERHRQIAPPTGHSASQCSGPCPRPPSLPKARRHCQRRPPTPCEQGTSVPKSPACAAPCSRAHCTSRPGERVWGAGVQELPCAPARCPDARWRRAGTTPTYASAY